MVNKSRSGARVMGGDYAYSLAKFLCDPHLVQEQWTEDIAKRVAFVISWVSEDVDSTVGGEPDVVIIKDEKTEITRLPKEDVQKEIEQAKEIKRKLPNILFSKE